MLYIFVIIYLIYYVVAFLSGVAYG